MIYFDHNATTPLLPEVIDLMGDINKNCWGNPSSTHKLGQKAFGVLENSRHTIAQLLDTNDDEIIFTGSGTESNNIAILGICDRYTDGEVIVSSIEHPAVSQVTPHLKNRGFKLLRVPVDEYARINLSELEKMFTEKTRLVSIMWANNETGTIQPIEEIASLCNKHKVAFHTDAVQAAGKILINLKSVPVTMLSCSAHKMCGPKGCGALFVRRGTLLSQRVFGGGQERNIRSGTQNVTAIAGFARAFQRAMECYPTESKRLFELTEYLWQKIAHAIPNSIRNGHEVYRIPNTLNVSFPGTTAEMVLASLDHEGICASGGSACASGSLEPSHVITAMGRRKQDAIAAIRFSLGRSNTHDEVDTAVTKLQTIVERIRRINS